MVYVCAELSLFSHHSSRILDILASLVLLLCRSDFFILSRSFKLLVKVSNLGFISGLLLPSQAKASE